MIFSKEKWANLEGVWALAVFRRQVLVLQTLKQGSFSSETYVTPRVG